MHPALENYEVICAIVSCVHHGSLPALASTCRAFECPALDVLWKDLQSIEPLVHCLPRDLFSIERGRTVLRKPIDAKMWEILHKYTSRVYSLTQRTYSRTIEALSSLMLSCPTSSASLFPHLRKLTWEGDVTQCAAEFLRMAFVPSLLSLDMCIGSSPSSAFLSVFSSLGSYSPHIQEMTVATHETSDIHRVSSFVTQPILQLHHLRTLSVWDIGNQGIEHLMHLPALQSLSLDLRTSCRDRRAQLQFPGFHDLKSLRLAARPEDASEFLNSLQFVRSKSLIFHLSPVFFPTSPATRLSNLFTILQERWDNDYLEEFTLEFETARVQTRPDDFMPLQACYNLKQLHVKEGCNTSMSGEELCQLVSAWPKLEGLSIGCLAISSDTSILTFQGLIGLLRTCPALTSLSLVINTLQLEGIDLKFPGGGVCNKNIKTLVLGNSMLESPLDVALIFSGLFPYLEQVKLWELVPQRPWAMDQWTLVNAFLRGCNILRERYTEA